MSITALVVGLQTDPPVGHKGHTSPEAIVILGGVGLLLAVCVLVGALMRRRSFAVFSLFFLGFAVESSLGVLALFPFWALAFWMFMRSSKMQRSLTARGDHPRQQRSRANSSRSGSTRSTGSSRGRRKKAAEPVGPAPNKRYTPPKPKEDGDR